MRVKMKFSSMSWILIYIIEQSIYRGKTKRLVFYVSFLYEYIAH